MGEGAGGGAGGGVTAPFTATAAATFLERKLTHSPPLGAVRLLLLKRRKPFPGKTNISPQIKLNQKPEAGELFAHPQI